MTEPLRQRFEQLHGRPPQWIAQAPGRVNLIGEHTDYNGGFVLPMAIDRHTQIAAALNPTNIIRVHSTAVPEVLTIDLRHSIEPGPKGEWANYPKGVIAGFVNAGISLPGFDALIDSNVPLGGGLSSSAALEVALATLLEAIIRSPLEPARKAALCREAEHKYAHVPCGIMDQLVCTLGKESNLVLIDCASEKHTYVELTDPAISVLIINTNVKHQLAGSEYALRREQCETAAGLIGVGFLRDATREHLERWRDVLTDIQYHRARHVITENVRVERAVDYIQKRQWLAVGLLMYASHESLRDDYEVSCPELDAIVEIAQNIGPKGGVYGCRMTGGGFGGCAVALIETKHQRAITDTIATEYRTLTGIEPTLFVSRPAEGACVINV